MNTVRKRTLLALWLVMVCCLAACVSADQEDTQPRLNPGDSNCAHTWTAWEVTKEQNCSRNGSQKRHCEICGREEEESLLAWGHIYLDGRCIDCDRPPRDCEHDETYDLVTAEADCENEGETRTICQKCKAVVHQETIHAYRHREWETVVIREATCTEGSIEQYWCKICGIMIDEYYGPTKDHDYGYVEGLQPTCTEEGWTSYMQCAVCGYIDGYQTLSALGHGYVAGICCRCELVGESFEMMDAPPFQDKLLEVEESAGKNYDVPTAKVEHFKPELGSDQRTYTWTISAAVKGQYVIWVDGLWGDSDVNVKLLDSEGNLLFQLNTRDGGNCFIIELQAGAYTLEVFQGYPTTGYALHVGHPTQPVDISGYDVIHDQMVSFYQSNTYTYTPETSGVYSFSFSGFTGNAEASVKVCAENGRILENRQNMTNGSGITLELEAGQTYTLYMENGPYISPFTLTISTQRPVLDVTGYTGVADRLSYQSQQRSYSFVASHSAYTFLLHGMDDEGAFVKAYFYGPDGELLYKSDWWPNDSSFSWKNMEVGKTYTIVLEQSYRVTDFILHLLTPGDPVQIRDHVGIRDEILYAGQSKTYRFTMEHDGDYCLAMDIHADNDLVGLFIEVYDSENNMLIFNTLMDGDTLDLDFLEVGQTYTIYITQMDGPVQYTFCIQE